MVAMPMQRALYPADWEAISLRIRERAGWRCEACGVAQGAEVAKVSSKGKSPKTHKVVLTVAHLNHEPSDVRPENLRAWCPTCHLRYDVEHHSRNRARHRREAQVAHGQLALWDAQAGWAHAPASRSDDEIKRVGRQRRRPARREDYDADAPISPPPMPAKPPLRATPLVWGTWPTQDEPLVIEGDPDTERRWAFAGEMACGKERLGVLLAPWEQRSERERVEQRWVEIERVRRVVGNESGEGA